MIEKKVLHYKASMLGGILLIIIGMLFPLVTKASWFSIIFKIRDAIKVGDSGHLILAGAYMSILYAVQSTTIFLGAILILYYTKIKSPFNQSIISVIAFIVIIFLHIIDSLIFNMPWEIVSTTISLIITLFIFEKLLWERNNFIQISIISIQVFFAFQWLNIMPVFSSYYIGQSDIPSSIKIAGLYLNASTVLNFTGFAFFLPFICSSFVTTILFMSFSQNINVMKENYKKENEIQEMKRKILENGIYKEINSLVHDLKTPLVTIRGLNSLIGLTKDQKKVGEYSERIDNSVGKMAEMISSFLYESSRQKLNGVDLINFLRAQLPLDDDTIKTDMKISDELPDIYVNKIRVARAIINLLENAIIVPCNQPYKHIIFEVFPVDKGMHIIVKDNGIGIEEDDLKRIWEIGFSKNNTSGLGLPFAKQIIEDNGGTIGIKSKPNQGTVVTVFLPEMDITLDSNL